MLVSEVKTCLNFYTILTVLFFNLNKYGNDASKVGYEISRLYCQDIDTLEDFENAEKLFPILIPNLFLK